MVERILLAVDESAAARRAVEYVGRVFGHHPKANVQITLFHVIEQAPSDPSTEAVQRAEKQLERYRELLLAAGVPESAIHVKHRLDEARPEAKRVAAALAIIDEVKKGGFTTVVVGRRGTSNIPELFLGGVAEKVARNLTGAAVWIVD